MERKLGKTVLDFKGKGNTRKESFCGIVIKLVSANRAIRHERWGNCKRDESGKVTGPISGAALERSKGRDLED